MQFIRNSNLNRSDTIFGVCQSLGEDLGISPNWIRVALAAVVILNFKLAMGVYAGLAVLVLLSRTIYPSRAVEQTVSETAPVAGEAATPAAQEQRILEAA